MLFHKNCGGDVLSYKDARRAGIDENIAAKLVRSRGDSSIAYNEQQREAIAYDAETNTLFVNPKTVNAESVEGIKVLKEQATRPRDIVATIDGTSVERADVDVNQTKEIKDLKAFGRKLGRRVVMVKSLPANANGVMQNGVIYVSETAQRPMFEVLKHELTHTLRGAKTWDSFADYAVEQLHKNLGEEYDGYLQSLSDTYAEAGKPLNEDALREELTANYVERYLFADQQAVNDLVKQSRSTAYRIWTMLRDMVQSFTGNLTAEQKTIRDAERMFAKALGQTKNPATGGRVVFKLNPNFKADYDRWIKDGRSDKEVFSVGVTSKALSAIGVGKKGILWDASKINKTLRKHNGRVTDEVIKQVPQLLENPIVILHAKAQEHMSRILLLGEVYDDNGVPVVAVVELLPRKKGGEYLLDDVKASTYLKTDQKNQSSTLKTQNLIDTSTIMYVEPNRKKTDTWLSGTGLQLPFAVKYGLNYTIQDLDADVNRKSLYSLPTNSIRALEAMDADYMQAAESGDTETAQRMVDEAAKEAGYNVHAYHGTRRGDRVGNVFLPERDKRADGVLYRQQGYRRALCER